MTLCGVQTGTELTFLLPPLPECWLWRCIASYLTIYLSSSKGLHIHLLRVIIRNDSKPYLQCEVMSEQLTGESY